MFHSRDPLMVTRKLIDIIENDIKRYNKAAKEEEIGKEENILITTKSGSVIEKTSKKGLDNRVTALGLNIIKSGKIINEILNPKQSVNPLFQQNNQYNFNLGAADEIRNLPEEERGQIIKFIDEKLDGNR